LSCGYSLNGLPGDPIRCPECGVDNPRKCLSDAFDEHDSTGVDSILSALAFSSLSAVAVVAGTGLMIWSKDSVYLIIAGAALKVVCLRRYGYVTSSYKHRWRFMVSFEIYVVMLFVGVIAGVYAADYCSQFLAEHTVIPEILLRTFSYVVLAAIFLTVLLFSIKKWGRESTRFLFLK